MIKKIALLSLLLSVCSLLSANREYRLQGTIGKIPIYMYIQYFSETDDDNLMGTYFYQTSLKDIVVRGSMNNNTFVLKVESGVDNVTETFSLVKKGNQFEGVWTNDKGKKLAVNLNPIDVYAISNKYDAISYIDSLKSSDEYNYARSAFIELKRDSVSTMDGKSFVWFSEKHCQAPFFRLGNGFDKKQVELINPQLDEIHFSSILSQLTCSSDWHYSEGDGIDYITSINYLDRNLLGFEVFASWYCGGAHPDFGGVSYLFDLNSGKSYDLKDVYALTPEKLYGLLDEQYHFEKPTSEDDYCDYTDLEVWEYNRWSIAKEGVYFTPYFYRAARSCEDAFIVPFSKLQKYKKASFPYSLDK